MTERPFKISIPLDALETLHQKLALTSLPNELEDAGWDYGAPLSNVRRLVTRWREGYDWRKHEAALNDELPQFTRDIEVDGFGALNIHYVHSRSEVVDAIPLLFVHGWPGSFIEVRKILPLLNVGGADYPAFHVVAISLPGYGFSEAPEKKGFELIQFAEVCNKLMISLGYKYYVTQGGDWGYFITRKMAQLYGHTHVKAWHSNFALARPPHPLRNPLVYLSDLLFGYTSAERDALKRMAHHRMIGTAYTFLHATKPQTIGYSLTDSPAGLLAWIYEKLIHWTDEYPWDDDEVLTWISIYWFSRAGPAASIRIYYEVSAANPDIFTGTHPTTIPMGYSYFPKELISFPRRWRKAPNLVFESEHESGGHFAAHERPHDLVADLRIMFGKGGPVFGVVPGRAGYA